MAGGRRREAASSGIPVEVAVIAESRVTFEIIGTFSFGVATVILVSCVLKGALVTMGSDLIDVTVRR